MYLRFDTCLEFPQLAKQLRPETTEASLEWDTENVYEWMYIDLPQLPFSLNVSREHGYADVADDILDQYKDDNEKMKQIVQPGPVYVMGWNRNADQYIYDLPDSLPELFADHLAVEVAVFSGRLNVDADDGEPLRVVKPKPISR